MATLRLEIVTPEARSYSEDVDMVVLPGMHGEMGILPNHVPLMTELKPGELKVTRGGKDIYLAVGEGFVEITQERVSVMTDMAIEAQAIDENAAQTAIDRAQEAIKNKDLGQEEHAAVMASMQKSLAQLHVKRHRHNV
jgi:F-type H+-transporting ATPase subunit epsilon